LKKNDECSVYLNCQGMNLGDVQIDLHFKKVILNDKGKKVSFPISKASVD